MTSPNARSLSPLEFQSQFTVKYFGVKPQPTAGHFQTIHFGTFYGPEEVGRITVVKNVPRSTLTWQSFFPLGDLINPDESPLPKRHDLLGYGAGALSQALVLVELERRKLISAVSTCAEAEIVLEARVKLLEQMGLPKRIPWRLARKKPASISSFRHGKCRCELNLHNGRKPATISVAFCLGGSHH